MAVDTNWMEKGRRAMTKLGQIADGYTNLMRSELDLMPAEERNLYEPRYAICVECPVRSGNTCSTKRSIKHAVTGEYVSGCGCGLAASTKSPTYECPAGKWGRVDHLLPNHQ